MPMGRNCHKILNTEISQDICLSTDLQLYLETDGKCPCSFPSLRRDRMGKKWIPSVLQLVLSAAPGCCSVSQAETTLSRTETLPTEGPSLTQDAHICSAVVHP